MCHHIQGYTFIIIVIIVSLRRSSVLTKTRKVAVMTSCIMQLVLTSGLGYGLSVMFAELVIVFDAKRADAALIQSLNMGLSTLSDKYFK